VSFRSIAVQIAVAHIDPALLLDLEGRVLAFNRAFCELTELRPRQLQRRLDAVETAFELVGGAEDHDLFRVAVEQGRSVNAQKRNVPCAANELTEAMTGLVPLRDGDGPIDCVLYTVRDLSAEARTQDKLRVMIDQERARADELEARVLERTQELEASRRAAEAAAHSKSEFLATMSHELRTPMNAIMGLVSLVLDDDHLQGDSRDSLKLVEASSKAMLVMLSDVLDFSKIEAGRLELESIAFDLPLLTRQVGRLMGVQASSKGLDWGVQIDDAIARHVVGDPVRLRQVLTNLTNNAVKFTESGGIYVRIAAVEDRVRFEVEDSGIGISAEHQAKIFDKFTQAESSTTRRFGGTGLGLAICRHLVELMGGQIQVKSEIGRGTTFYFDIPMASADAPTETTRKVAHSVEHFDLDVLLVEDNPVNQKVATKMLERLGCRARIAGSGYEAIAEAQHHTFDLILMDCQMPGMDGLEATREIRALGGRCARVPIIALTANVQDGVRERCLEVGMNDYLSKPIDRGALRTTIQTWSTPDEDRRAPGVSAAAHE
jgi:signal transduction histidine kinase/ActR/RegA family two-component response regulator